MNNKSLARLTAELIASEFFSYGPKTARRLVLEFNDGRLYDGPGWSREPMVDKIEDILSRKHCRRKKPLTHKKAA